MENVSNNNNRRNLYIGIGVGCLLICVVTAGALALAGGSFVNWVMEEPENVIIGVDTPDSVTVGQDFILTVSITNTDTAAQVLDSIDIDDSLMSGFLAIVTTPMYSDYSIIDFGFTFHSYEFLASISPNQTLAVQFEMRAISPGIYSGEVDACINDPSVCTSNVVRIAVEP